MDYPKISIITPSFNQVTYLEKTILSIVNQNYPNLEYIIIDGGSTDGSVEIIKKYASKLSYWISEPDKGIYYALQKGFEQSTGDIMGWLNSDDLLYNCSLFTIADIFKVHPSIKWITGIPSTIDRTDRVINLQGIRKWSKFNYLQKDFNIIQQESTYWKRELWNKAGSAINLNYKLAGDLELWSRFFLYEKLYSVTVPIGCFRSRPGEQLSSKHANKYHDEVDIILSSMAQSETEKKVLNQIEFYKKHKRLLKSDTLRNKYISLYDYPPYIDYSFDREEFVFVDVLNGGY